MIVNDRRHGTGRAASARPGLSPAASPAVWRAVLVALAVIAAGDVGAVLTVGRRSAQANVASRTEVVGPGTGGTSPAVAPAGAGLPRRLEIASLGLQTDLIDLVLGPDGVLAPPDDTATAGWWSQGTVPGETGPAVIVGHVDSKTGPAVFFRIHELNAGNLVSVIRDDGKVVTFVVDQVEQYKKAELPTALVYGPTPTPTLRLITCGGRFDKRKASYESNVVVFAHQAEQLPDRVPA